MKAITPRHVLALLLVCVAPIMFAQGEPAAAEVTFCTPGNSKNPLPRDQFVALTLDGPVLMYESDAVPNSDVVAFVNGLLETKHVTYVGLYIREGTSYGDVVHAVDLLRKTNAKSIGVSVSNVPKSQGH